MVKYEVRTVSVETKNGKDALSSFLNQADQDTRLVKAFDTAEEALALYNSISTSAKYERGYAMGYYLHECKLIEISEYDEDGEWIGGGDWLVSEFPDKEEV